MCPPFLVSGPVGMWGGKSAVSCRGVCLFVFLRWRWLGGVLFCVLFCKKKKKNKKKGVGERERET